jgi:hypothetical protein
MFLGPAEASEFLADVVMKGGMTSGDGKLWVKGHKSRQEMGSKAEKMILIMDMDQGYHWTLMPDMKMYLKTSIQDDLFIVPSDYQEMPSQQMPGQNQ